MASYYADENTTLFFNFTTAWGIKVPYQVIHTGLEFKPAIAVAGIVFYILFLSVAYILLIKFVKNKTTQKNITHLYFLFVAEELLLNLLLGWDVGLKLYTIWGWNGLINVLPILIMAVQ